MSVVDTEPSIVAHSRRAWWLACRPNTLSAAAVPVLVGSAVAHRVGGFDAGPAVAALLGALLLQIGSNLANDLYDYEKGADTHDRLGPVRAVQAGLLTPAAVRRSLFVVFGLALLLGVYLTSIAGWLVVLIGLCSIAAAVLYTAGPYPLGYHGLGDLFVFVFFGFVAVCGTVFVQTLDLPTLAIWASLPVGSLATAILVVNNVRDRETDVLANKRTLAVRWGRQAGLYEYLGLVLVSYLVPCTLVISGQLGAWGLLPLASAPLGLWLVKRVFRDRGRPLNQALVGTAKLLLVYGLLLTLGLVLDARVAT